MDSSPPGSSVHQISQARILEWIAIFLQGIFLTQGLNPCLLHWQVGSCIGKQDLGSPLDPAGSNPGLPHYRRILYQLSHQGRPRILEWVAYPVCSRSSWSRSRTGVSCIAGIFFTSWATRESPRSCRVLNMHLLAVCLVLSLTPWGAGICVFVLWLRKLRVRSNRSCLSCYEGWQHICNLTVHVFIIVIEKEKFDSLYLISHIVHHYLHDIRCFQMSVHSRKEKSRMLQSHHTFNL